MRKESFPSELIETMMNQAGFSLEARMRVELMVEVLQTSALPLGYRAGNEEFSPQIPRSTLPSQLEMTGSSTYDG